MAVDMDCEFTMEIRDSPPSHLLMKIESFAKLSVNGIMKRESKEFVAGNYKWKLTFCPQDIGGSNISVFLSVAEPESVPEGWEVTAECSILLHKQISNNYYCFRGKARSFDAKNSRWGFSISSKLLAEACNGGNNCTFGAEVFVSRTQVSAGSSLHGWKISDFSKLGDVWNSEEFLAEGFRWKMKLYPNGNGSAKGKSVSIYLECVDSKTFPPHEKVKANFCVRIKNQLPPHSHVCKLTSHSFSSKTVDWGFTDFVPISDMRDPSKGFIINDCCFLEVEIGLVERGEVEESSTHIVLIMV